MDGTRFLVPKVFVVQSLLNRVWAGLLSLVVCVESKKRDYLWENAILKQISYYLKIIKFFISIFKVKYLNTQIQLCVLKKTINKNYSLSSEAKSAVWLMGTHISLCVCVVVKQTQSVMQMRYLESFYCCCNSQQGFKNIINNESTRMFCLLLSVVLLCNSKLVVSGYWSFSSFHFFLFWFVLVFNLHVK